MSIQLFAAPSWCDSYSRYAEPQHGALTNVMAFLWDGGGAVLICALLAMSLLLTFFSQRNDGQQERALGHALLLAALLLFVVRLFAGAWYLCQQSAVQEMMARSIDAALSIGMGSVLIGAPVLLLALAIGFLQIKLLRHYEALRKKNRADDDASGLRFAYPRWLLLPLLSIGFIVFTWSALGAAFLCFAAGLLLALLQSKPEEDVSAAPLIIDASKVVMTAYVWSLVCGVFIAQIGV